MRYWNTCENPYTVTKHIAFQQEHTCQSLMYSRSRIYRIIFSVPIVQNNSSLVYIGFRIYRINFAVRRDPMYPGSAVILSSEVLIDFQYFFRKFSVKFSFAHNLVTFSVFFSAEFPWVLWPDQGSWTVDQHVPPGPFRSDRHVTPPIGQDENLYSRTVQTSGNRYIYDVIKWVHHGNQ